MAKPNKRSTLEALTKKRLTQLTQKFELDVAPSRPKAEFIDVLANSKASFAAVLGELNRAEMKDVCQAHDLDDSGTEKPVLLARILGDEEAATPPAAPKSKRGVKNKTSTSGPAEQLPLEALSGQELGGSGITGALKSKVDALWTTFWSNGISNPLTVIEQISYLLFIKRLDDEELAKEARANRLGQPSKGLRFGPDQQHIRWSQFKNMGDAEAMLAVVRDQAFPFIKELGGADGETSYARHMKDAVFLVASPAVLDNVVDQIDQLPMQDRDTKGDLYEYMLSKLTTAGTNGQFRTPRHIIKMMVQMIDPKPSRRETICDPACGTAGFLVAAAEHVRDAMLGDTSLRGHYNAGMFHGFDFDATMLRIGSMNMMQHGIENPDIRAQDSLNEDAAGNAGSYTVVLANPPFKGSVEKSTIAKDLVREVKTTKTELLFLVQIIRILALGGRAAVILPDGVLFGSSTAHQDVRKLLVDDHKLDGVVSMPPGVFKPYAGVSTAILLFTKTGAGGTDLVWFYDMQADGLSLDDKRQVVGENDIPDVLAKWAARDAKQASDRKARSFFVAKSEIVANKYDLSINRYKEVEHAEVEYDPPKMIIDRLELLQNEISRELEALQGMV